MYITRNIYEALHWDDRNFGGPKIWRNFAKTVTFRTSQKIKEFSSFCYVTQIEFLKFVKIMFKLLLKQNDTHQSISASSSTGFGLI